MSSPKLTLYIDGTAERAHEVIANAETLRERHTPGISQLVVIDVIEDASAAQRAGVMAVPTLEYYDGATTHRAVGDFTNVESVLRALGLSSKLGGNQGADDAAQ